MYEDDYLMRQVRRAVEALARLARGESVQREELDQAARDAVGLDLATLDALPSEALLGLWIPDDVRSAERLRTVSLLLEATAPEGAAGDWRRAKALRLRQVLGEH